jgi:preprotein translocase subunit SecB
MAEPNDRNGSDRPTTPQFVIQKIYVRDLSFESPAAPQVFTEQIVPQANLQLSNSSTLLAEGVHEVVLSLTVTATHNEKTIFLVEVQQAGVFSLVGYSASDSAAMLGSYCPNILFPFAREAVADLVAKGGFPTLLLAPINFDALYAQHLQRKNN